ncbi:hypothetical protein VNO80_11158 [Phaseolus coccineus]|uniref:SHSP domain-containing protein n=1 Tax=Phaseolus coccineus TaxID=3886 RepID=A0AAN9RF92_PHACN
MVRDGDSVELSLNQLELDMWRFNLPKSTQPKLVSAMFVDGKLIMIVPKGHKEEDKDGDRGMGGGKLMLHKSTTTYTSITILVFLSVPLQHHHNEFAINEHYAHKLQLHRLWESEPPHIPFELIKQELHQNAIPHHDLRHAEVDFNHVCPHVANIVVFAMKQSLSVLYMNYKSHITWFIKNQHTEKAIQQ